MYEIYQKQLLMQKMLEWYEKQQTMYKTNQKQKTSLVGVNEQLEGERIELKMERMMATGATIDDNTELMFTDRKDGIVPEFNIRHDHWETAVEATDLQTKQHLTKREERHKPPTGGDGGEGKTDTNVG